MDLNERDLRAVPNSGTLVELPNGIRIVRRRKHESLESRGIKTRDLAAETSARKGSKFLASLTLKRIVEMTAEVLEEQGAVRDARAVYNRVYGEPIGVSKGKKVRKLRVELNGGCAHAYPIDEDE
jgi:hypothetical protein